MTDQNKIKEFLRECHKYMSSNFDNSPHIPIEIELKYKKVIDTTEEWENYLLNKYSYLKYLKEDRETADKNIYQELENSGKTHLKEFVLDWREVAADEELVYKYRYSQLPPDCAHKRWYCPTKMNCWEWLQDCQDELENLKKKVLPKSWRRICTDTYKIVADDPFIHFEDEYLLSFVCRRSLQRLTRRVNELYSYLSKVPQVKDLNGSFAMRCQETLDFIERDFNKIKIDEGKSETNYITMEGNFLPTLCLKLSQVLYGEEFDETALIQKFSTEVKEHFGCEVCDYLDATKDMRKILWRIGTTNHEDLSPKYQKLSEAQIRQEVQKYESYSNGEGISGSILLLDAPSGRNIWFHVGSNDVLCDPRQSKEHRAAYETDMYPGVLKKTKRIENFWIFPVFEADRLRGAFRVVNKLTEDGKSLQPGGWPYHLRVQLTLITQWFSDFLMAVQPQLRERPDFAEIFKRREEIKRMIKELRLDWLDQEKFRSLLRHLTKDIAKKKEERSIGCCIMIVKSPPNKPSLEYLHSYSLLDPSEGQIVEPYSGLDIYHDMVDPLKGAYLFDQDGKFIRIVDFYYEKKGTSGLETMTLITNEHKESVCLMLCRDTKIIRVYKNGGEVCELYLSEGTGEWQFRYPQEILKTMEDHMPSGCKPEVIERVFKACLELSYQGHGSIVVIGDIVERDFIFEPTGRQRCRLGNIKDLRIPLFVEIIKSEGATFVRNGHKG